MASKERTLVVTAVMGRSHIYIVSRRAACIILGLYIRKMAWFSFFWPLCLSGKLLEDQLAEHGQYVFRTYFLRNLDHCRFGSLDLCTGWGLDFLWTWSWWWPLWHELFCRPITTGVAICFGGVSASDKLWSWLGFGLLYLNTLTP